MISKDDLTKRCSDLAAKITAASDLKMLDDVRVETFGKQGEVSSWMRHLASLSAVEKKDMGAFLNTLKNQLQTCFDAQKSVLDVRAASNKIAREYVDMTLPTQNNDTGVIHPLSETLYQMTMILKNMGFWVGEGPDIENDDHNFTALNIPEDHPARGDHDTFYMKPGPNGVRDILRTHTSPVQIRTLRSMSPPIRMIAPGRVYRSDYDQTHTPTFHQLEALYVDKNVTFAHLKGCIIDFCRLIFGVADLPVRFRPSYFPFTEPSAEVDIGCSRKDGRLMIGGGDDWLEILGCGMVHPAVLDNCGIDSGTYQGFAFGIGVERVTMLRYGISDLRSFYDGDRRFLSTYGLKPSAAFLTAETAQ